MRIAIASFDGMPDEFTDDETLRDALLATGSCEVAIEPWDEDLAWDEFDIVVVRSTWDYATRRDEFCAWADSVGARLANAPAVLRWNSDKTYLKDLATAGVPVVATEFLEPGAPWPGAEGREVVVKPTISAGGRDTGRFGPELEGAARALIGSIHAGGRTAMVQPYLSSVDSAGETALVFIDGELSHSLRKQAVLRPDEVAPVRADRLGAAEAMYDPELVLAGSAQPDEVELAERIIAHVNERFKTELLYGRVDMLRGGDGDPVLLELELVEPNLYLGQAPKAASRLADAILVRSPARP